MTTESTVAAPSSRELAGVEGLQLVWRRGDELRTYEALSFGSASGVNRVLRVLAAFGMLTRADSDYQLDYIAPDGFSILGEISLTKDGFDFFRRKWRPPRSREAIDAAMSAAEGQRNG